MPLIDYFTTIAQIINFLVLVFLLRHFLFKPVIKSMDEREMRIVSRLKEAEEKKTEAEREAESYRKMEQELADNRNKVLAKVEEEVSIFRQDLTQKARQEVEESKARWYETVMHQKEEFLADLNRRAGKEIYVIVRRVLEDLANDELETEIIRTFLERLRNMEEPELKAFRELLKDSDQKVVVRSAFEIPEEWRRRISETLKNQFGKEVGMLFETDNELISGIEMSANSIRISWSIASYLEALEEDLSRILDQKTAQERSA